jgi:hypothetical protein
LHAVALDEVRGMIGATDAEAGRLRAIATERFGRGTRNSHGLLSKLGPVMRRPVDAPVLRPDTPLAQDCDRLLAGQHVPPQRLAASWRLLQGWIEATAWGTHHSPLDNAALKNLDFDLARAGVAARHGVSALLEHPLEIGLLPAPGLAVGYRDGAHVRQLAASWRTALPELEPPSSTWVTEVADWLDRFGQWTTAAATAERPAPDLIAILAA